MEKEIKIIVADTNWWISLIIKKFNNKFATILSSPNLKFVTSQELTNEIRETLSKERLQKNLDQETIDRLGIMTYLRSESLKTPLFVR